MSKIFLVAVDEDESGESVRSRLIEKFGDENVYAHSERLLWVASDTKRFTGEIAAAAGFKSNDRAASGIVIRVHSGGYSAYTYKRLWQWLEQVEED